MKWTLADSTHPRYKYQLSSNEKQLLSISLDISTGSVRVGDHLHKRVFLVYREGFLKNKVVLRNEYGVRLLSLITETGLEGEIRFDDRVYRFIFDEKDGSLSIYKPESLNPLASYKLPEVRVFNGAKKGVSSELTLIAVSSWYSLSTVSTNEPALV